MIGRALWVGCAVLFVASCRRHSEQPVAEAPPVEEAGPGEAAAPGDAPAQAKGQIWTSLSHDRSAQLEQTQTATGCAARCIAQGTEIWSSDHCLGGRGEPVFLTRDCEVLISVVASPQASQRWADTVVLRRWARATREQEYRGGPMLAEASVEKRAGAFRWLASEPGYMRGGAGVELTVLTGLATRLPFRDSTALGEERYENAGSPSAPARPPPAREVRIQGRYWEAPPAGPKQAAPAAAPPAPAPAAERNYKLRVRTEDGWEVDIPVQAPPTIKSENGEGLVCRREGQGCGTNADCCGGNCSGGTCH